MHVDVRLTIINDADHHSITSDVVAPNWHHVQVEATRSVLSLCKLHMHTQRNKHTTLFCMYYLTFEKNCVSECSYLWTVSVVHFHLSFHVLHPISCIVRPPFLPFFHHFLSLMCDIHVKLDMQLFTCPLDPPGVSSYCSAAASDSSFDSICTYIELYECYVKVCNLSLCYVAISYIVCTIQVIARCYLCINTSIAVPTVIDYMIRSVVKCSFICPET